MNIPTVQPVSKQVSQHVIVDNCQKPQSTKAVFLSQDIENSFERDMQKQHAKNFEAYKRLQLNKGARS